MKRKIFIPAVIILLAAIISPALVNASVKSSEATSSSSQQLSTPLFKGNLEKSKENFITKENAISKANIKKEGRIISSDLKTWNQFSTEVLEKSNSMSQIEDNRMVWVVKVDYPNGIDTRGGYFNKATQITVFDAETGQILNVTTMGDSPSRDHTPKQKQSE